MSPFGAMEISLGWFAPGLTSKMGLVLMHFRANEWFGTMRKKIMNSSNE
jgi:hypothetical protein